MLDKDDGAGLANGNGRQAFRGSDGVALAEDVLQLLEGASDSLHAQQVPEDGFD